MMFDGNAIPVDVQKQQRVVEKLRDNLETELGYNIFSKSLRSGYERISIIHKLTQDSLDNIDNVDYDQLCMDKTDCDVLLTLQTQASHALCTNDLQVRAYQEAYIYLSRLLNKDVNREFWLDEGNVKNEFEKFSTEISSVDPSTLKDEVIIKKYWIGNISNSLIGQICIEIDKESMMKIIRMKESSLSSKIDFNGKAALQASYENALKNLDATHSRASHAHETDESQSDEHCKSLVDALKHGRKLVAQQKRTQSRIMLKPLQMLNSKRHTKTATLPPLPRGLPPGKRNNNGVGKSNNEKGNVDKDFDFI